MPASLKKGVNKLTLLVDNLGRRYAGPRLGEERKGLYGHVYDAKPLRTRKPKIKTEESLNRRLVPRHQAYLLNDVQGGPVHTAAIDVTLSKVTPVHLRFGNVSCHVAVMCNGRLAGFFARHDGVCWGELTLGSELKKGRNTISLVCWGELDAKELAANVELHALENLSDEAKWSWRAWGVPEGEGPLVGKDQPAWYATKFKYPGGPAPLFLNILSAKKGQIFLNGHNVGRFWTLGPQHRYYLPECWLAEENELLIFEEHGGIPSSSRLEHCPNGPHAE
jgi:hypothetical protein